ncbi:carbohydrate ABC transporter permease [Alkalicoccus daliensis]|uniref:Multiple sugar transport system permease protein n=1 Tax=Alkalicoccus daliensis TaxID=745820 RepID=A0A1H0GDV6_9BACI|nr:carbohydrate ABC transporter permease [Alkalicoccus daliensis]SDO05097.1 multiple sugar transport system permease protein [Alkalicoccus daliensis]
MNKLIRIFVGTFLIILIAFPFYWVLISSFKPSDQILSPDLWPETFTLVHYVELLEQTPYLTNLFNSVFVAGMTMVFTVLIVIPAAYGIFRFQFIGRNFLFRLILASYIFPGVLLLVPVYQLMSDLGLVNSLWSLVIINVTFAAPFAVWLMRGFFDAIPTELDEAASIDGAGPMKTLFLIIIPLIKPGIATIAIYAFVLAWTEFTFASILITEDSQRVLTTGMNAIMGQYTVRWGWTTAGAVLTVIPVLIFFAFVGRYFVRGLASGAVKT